MREVVQKVYKFNELEKKVQEEVIKRKRDTWVDGMNCELNNGVKVKTYTAMGARYLSVYMPQENDRTAFYTLSIDEWDANKIIKLLNKMMYLTAQGIEAAFVYDDFTEEGIWESLTLAKAGQIG